MRCANQEIIRERQPVLTVKEVLQDWMEAQYLAVWTWSGDFVWYFLQRRVRMWQHLWLTAGFTDIPVSCFMLGVIPVPKKKQVIQDVLLGCEGVTNIADDLVIHGKGIEQHDERLFIVLKRLKEVGLTMNGDKLMWVQVTKVDILWPSSDREWGRN